VVEVIVGERLKIVGKPKTILRKIPKSKDPKEEFLRKRVRASLKGVSRGTGQIVRVPIEPAVEPAVELPTEPIEPIRRITPARRPSTISAFQPTIFPSRKELGAERGFFEKLTQKDEGERFIDVPFSDPRVEEELRRRREAELIAGGLTVPAAFELKGIEKQVLARELPSLEKEFQTGAITEAQAQQRLQKAFETKAEPILLRRQRAKGIVTGIERVQKGIPAEETLKTGALIGGGVLAGEAAPAFFVAVGAKEFFSAVEQPTRKAKIAKSVEGVIIGGFGFAGITPTAQRLALERAGAQSALELAAAQRFKAGELGEIVLPISEKGAISRIGARRAREFGFAATEERLGVSGIILKKEPDILFSGRGIRRTDVLVRPVETGAKPVSFQFEEAIAPRGGFQIIKKSDVTTGFIGEIETQKPQRLIKFFKESKHDIPFKTPKGVELVGGVSRRVGGREIEDVFITRVGELEAIGVKIPKRQLGVGISEGDIIITRRLRTTAEPLTSLEVLPFKTGLPRPTFTRFKQVKQKTLAPALFETGLEQPIQPVLQLPKQELFPPTGAFAVTEQVRLIPRQAARLFSAPRLGEVAPLAGVNATGLVQPTLRQQDLTLFAPTLATVPFQKAGEEQVAAVFPAFVQPQALRERQTLALKTPTALETAFEVAPAFAPPISPISPRVPFAPRFMPFAFPVIPFGFGIPEPKQKKVKIKREFFRTPSFAAAQLGIEAFKHSPLEFTGLVERPILKKKKRKKKRG
jgi:hypothetical protein